MTLSAKTIKPANNREPDCEFGGLLSGVGPTMTELSFKGLILYFLNDIISAKVRAGISKLSDSLLFKPEPTMQTK